jgi:hypothetical protein
MGAVLLINHQPLSTPLEPYIPVNQNPIPLILPAGIPTHDSLEFACRLAQHCSDCQGQAPTMTNTLVAEAIPRYENA